MPLIWSGLEQSVMAPQPSLRKRLRVLWAMTRQQWHQKVCGECKASWWSAGPYREELIHICDDCESRLLDTMMDELERDHQQQMKGRA